MHQSIRPIRRHLIMTYVISLGLMTALHVIASAYSLRLRPAADRACQPGNRAEQALKGGASKTLPPPFHTQRNPWRRKARKPRPANPTD